MLAFSWLLLQKMTHHMSWCRLLSHLEIKWEWKGKDALIYFYSISKLLSWELSYHWTMTLNYYCRILSNWYNTLHQASKAVSADGQAGLSLQPWFKEAHKPFLCIISSMIEAVTGDLLNFTLPCCDSRCMSLLQGWLCQALQNKLWGSAKTHFCGSRLTNLNATGLNG